MVYSRSVVTAILAAGAVSSVLAVPVPGSTSTTSALAPSSTSTPPVSRRNPPGADAQPGASENEGLTTTDASQSPVEVPHEHHHKHKHPHPPQDAAKQDTPPKDAGVGKREFHEHHHHRHLAELLEEAEEHVHHAKHRLHAAEKHLHHLFHAEDEGEFVSKHRIHEAKHRLHEAEHRLHHAEKHLHRLEEEIDDGEFHPHHHHHHEHHEHEHHFRLGHAAAHHHAEHDPVLKIALSTRAVDDDTSGSGAGPEGTGHKKRPGTEGGKGSGSDNNEEVKLKEARQRKLEAELAELKDEKQIQEKKAQIAKEDQELEKMEQHQRVEYLKEKYGKGKGGGAGGKGGDAPVGGHHMGPPHKKHPVSRRSLESDGFLVARGPEGGEGPKEGPGQGQKKKRPMSAKKLADLLVEAKEAGMTKEEEGEYEKLPEDKKAHFLRKILHKKGEAGQGQAGQGEAAKGSKKQESPSSPDGTSEGAVGRRSLPFGYGDDLD